MSQRTERTMKARQALSRLIREDGRDEDLVGVGDEDLQPDPKEVVLWDAHDAIVKHFKGKFLNHGAASGDDFILSKTTVGRLLSRYEGSKIQHYWLPGGGRGFSAHVSDETPVNLKARPPRGY